MCGGEIRLTRVRYAHAPWSRLEHYIEPMVNWIISDNVVYAMVRAQFRCSHPYKWMRCMREVMRRQHIYKFLVLLWILFTRSIVCRRSAAEWQIYARRCSIQHSFDTHVVIHRWCLWYNGNAYKLSEWMNTQREPHFDLAIFVLVADLIVAICGESTNNRIKSYVVFNWVSVSIGW